MSEEVVAMLSKVRSELASLRAKDCADAMMSAASIATATDEVLTIPAVFMRNLSVHERKALDAWVQQCADRMSLAIVKHTVDMNKGDAVSLKAYLHLLREKQDAS